MLALLVATTVAHACAACACGDPTLTTMGVEKPFAGRVRLGSTVQARWETQPVVRGVQRWADEARLELAATWAPADWVIGSLVVPLVTAAEHGTDRSERRGTGLGDVEVQTRFVVVRDRTRRHLAGPTAGLALPTTTPVYDEAALAPLDAQPGTGAWAPSLGVWYGGFLGAWSVFASTAVRTSTTGWGGLRPGLAALGTVATQWQPHPVVAARVGVDVRAATPDRIDERIDPSTGGWVVQATPALTVAPTTDVLLLASVGVPVAQALGDGATEGPTVRVGVIVDL